MLLSDHEGLPMSLLEALSAGLPCVASAIPGCMEVLGLGAAGESEVGIAVPNDAEAAAAGRRPPRHPSGRPSDHGGSCSRAVVGPLQPDEDGGQLRGPLPRVVGLGRPHE